MMRALKTRVSLVKYQVSSNRVTVTHRRYGLQGSVGSPWKMIYGKYSPFGEFSSALSSDNTSEKNLQTPIIFGRSHPFVRFTTAPRAPTFPHSKICHVTSSALLIYQLYRPIDSVRCLDIASCPRSRFPTTGVTAVAVADRRLWNCLPSLITMAPSLATSGKQLKTELFRRSFG